MTLAVRVLIGLLAGFAIGLGLSGAGSPATAMVVGLLTPVGTIFVNLIRMTVVPLVACLLIASVGSLTVSGALQRTAVRAVGWSVVLLTLASAASVLVAVPVLARLQIDAEAARALGGSAATAAATAPRSASAGQFIVDLVSPNVFKAAADGAMVPIIIFAILLGLALTRVQEAKRAAALGVVGAFADAMQQLVTWILQLAPIGVFALAVPLGAALGLAAAGAVITYVLLVVGITVAATGFVLYPLGIVAGRMTPAAFAAFCAPAQAIGFAARSSLAALPAMVESAEQARLPHEASRVVMPLALAVFHFGTAIAQTVGVLFLARLFGVTLSPAQLASIVFAVVVSSYAVPGIPGGSIIAIVPVLSAANLPIEGVGILLAVDTIPDMFRTVANVTGAMALTAMLRSRTA